MQELNKELRKAAEATAVSGQVDLGNTCSDNADATHVPMTDLEKRALIRGFFTESWAVENALNLLHDFEQLNGIGVTK